MKAGKKTDMMHGTHFDQKNTGCSIIIVTTVLFMHMFTKYLQRLMCYKFKYMLNIYFYPFPDDD